jgi:hypothetical protein
VPYFANHFKDILRQCEQYGSRPSAADEPDAADGGGGGRQPARWSKRCSNAAPTARRSTTMATTPCTGLCARPSATRSSPAARSPRSTSGSPRPASTSIPANVWCASTGICPSTSSSRRSGFFSSRASPPPAPANGAFDTQAILDAWQHLPANIVRPERNKRQHLSSVLARNEIDRDYAYNRALFRRVMQGWYQFNPQLAVRRREGDEEIWPPSICRCRILPGRRMWRTGRDWAPQSAADHSDRSSARSSAPENWQSPEAIRRQPFRWMTDEARRIEIARVEQEIAARKKR